MEKLLTRNGVCKKLENSPYNFTYFHDGKCVTFNFSSKLHLDNFTKNRQKNFSMIYNDINKRFKFKIDCTYLADFNLYKKIENRGCFIRFGGDIVKDLDEVSILK
jgi:hypothetical protein